MLFRLLGAAQRMPDLTPQPRAAQSWSALERAERAADRAQHPEPADAQLAEPPGELPAEQPGGGMNKHARKRERRKAAAVAKAKQAEEEKEAAERRERRRWQRVRQVF